MSEKTHLPFNPDNDDDDEVAAWFDKHSTTDLPGEPVKVNVNLNRKGRELQPLTLRIDPEDMDQLRKLAEEAGIGYTTMARMLLHRELKNPPKKVNA